MLRNAAKPPAITLDTQILWDFPGLRPVADLGGSRGIKHLFDIRAPAGVDSYAVMELTGAFLVRIHSSR